MLAEEKKEKKLQDGKLNSEKVLTGTLYVITALCILGFIVQSIVGMLVTQ